jgi:hypothetical protein
MNESFFDFALCVICYYLSITLDLSCVLFLYPSTFAQFLFCVFFSFFFVSRSYLWPLLLLWFSFCKCRFSSLAIIFGFCLALPSYFCFSLLVYGPWLAFIFRFCLSLLVFHSCRVLIFRFYLLFFAYGSCLTLIFRFNFSLLTFGSYSALDSCF